MEINNWSIIVGFFLPIITAAILRTKWSEQIKSIVAFGISIVVAAGTLWLQKQFTNWDNLDNLVANALLLAVTAIASFKGFWKPSGIAKTIESNTG